MKRLFLRPPPLCLNHSKRLYLQWLSLLVEHHLTCDWCNAAQITCPLDSKTDCSMMAIRQENYTKCSKSEADHECLMPVVFVPSFPKVRTSYILTCFFFFFLFPQVASPHLISAGCPILSPCSAVNQPLCPPLHWARWRANPHDITIVSRPFRLMCLSKGFFECERTKKSARGGGW